MDPKQIFLALLEVEIPFPWYIVSYDYGSGSYIVGDGGWWLVLVMFVVMVAVVVMVVEFQHKNIW